MLTVLKGQINKHQLKNKGVMALCGAASRHDLYTFLLNCFYCVELVPASSGSQPSCRSDWAFEHSGLNDEQRPGSLSTFTAQSVRPYS